MKMCGQLSILELYNGCMRYFDKTFFKFLFGFLCLIALSLGVISYAKAML